MRTVQRVGFGSARDGRSAKAIQMFAPFTVNGVEAPRGSWIILYPDRHEFCTDAQFRNRYREVLDAPVQEAEV